MKNRLLFALKCVLLAAEEPHETHEGRSLVQRAMEYGRSARITKEEIRNVLDSKLIDTLLYPWKEKTDDRSCPIKP